MRVAQTQRLVLRHLTFEDAGFLCRMLNEPSWLRFIGDRGVRTPQDAQRYIQEKFVALYESDGFGMYLLELKDGGSPIGLCGLVKRDSLPGPDIGFALLTQFEGHGYAFEASKAVMNHAREEIHLTKLLAIVNPDNVGSIRLLERLGFSHEGAYRTPKENNDLMLYTTSL